jgi:hypothetical protein
MTKKVNPQASEWIPGQPWAQAGVLRSELEDALREQRLGIFYRNRLKTVQRADRRSKQIRKNKNALKTFCSKLNHIMKTLPPLEDKGKVDTRPLFKRDEALLKKLHEWLADAQGKRCAGYNNRRRWWRNLLDERQHAARSDNRVPIFVIGPDRTHALHLKRSDTMADVKAAVQELGYDLGVDRLCRFGGAPLPRGECLTLAESGLRANSSLQVLGRLHGGVEVTLFGQQHSLGDTGLLDLIGQDVGPAKLKEVAELPTVGNRRCCFAPESPTVRRLVLSGNMITDRGKDLSGLKALCEVLPTLNHLISLDLSNCGLGVAEVNEVAKAIGAGAAVASLKLGGADFGPIYHSHPSRTEPCFVVYNPDVGNAAFRNSPDMDDHADETSPDGTLHFALEQTNGLIKVADNKWLLERSLAKVDASKPCTFQTLCDTLKTSRVNEVDFSSCGLGSPAMEILSDYVREATAVVTSINCLANKFGEEDLATLLTAIEGTSVRSLCGLTEGQTVADFSGQNLGPIDVKIMAAEYGFHGFIAASAEVVILDGNPIGAPSSVDLKPGAATGVTVKKGVFAAVDGRFGEVTQNPDSDSEVMLCWLDDGSESGYTKVDKLTSVAASRTDLIEDYSHIRSLGEALTGSKVKTCGLANCKFNPVSLATFVESVRWAEAALNLLTLSSTGNKYKPKTYTLTAGEDKLELNDKNLGPADVNLISVWLATDAGAALNSLTVDMNGFFGELYSDGNVKEADKFAGDCDAFFAALKGSNIVTLSLQKTGIGPVTLRKLATSLPAAVARLILDENPLTGGSNWSSDFDKDITGVTALLDTLKTSSVTELGLAKCRLGPGSLGKLAEYVRDAEAAMNPRNSNSADRI